MRAAYVRETADVRRQSLIDATCRCLAENGVAGTSVRTICARAGVSAGLLTHYFSGVDALILAAYQDTGKRVSDAIDYAVAQAGPDPRDRLHAYILANFQEPIRDPELLATWIAFWGLIKTNDAIAAEHDRLYADYRSGIEALLTEHIGAAHRHDAIRRMAIGITALIDGLWLELCLNPATFSADEASLISLRWIEALTDRRD